MSYRFSSKSVWVIALWVGVYLFLMVTIITQMMGARQRHEDAVQTTVEALSTTVLPERETGMLSPERILQDHFVLYLTALIVFTTLVYGVMMYLFCGVTLATTAGPVTLEQELQNDQAPESENSAGEVVGQQG